MGIEVILKGGPADGMRTRIDPNGVGEYLFVDSVRTADQYKGGIAMLACPKCSRYCEHALADWTFASTASPSESVDPEAGIIATIRTYPRTGQPWVYVYRRLRDYDQEPVLYGYVERAEFPFTAYAHALDCACNGCTVAREQLVTEITNQIVAVASQLDAGDRIPDIDIDRLADKYRINYWDADSVLGRLTFGGVMYQGRVLPRSYWRGTVSTVPGSSVRHRHWATQDDLEMARQHPRGCWWDATVGAWLCVADQLPTALAVVGAEPVPGVRTRG